MRRPLSFRLLALAIALLASLAAPALAVAHGLAHDHLARAHHARVGGVGQMHTAPVAQGEATSAAPAVAPADHDHQHSHVAPEVAPGARHLDRLDLTAAPLVTSEPPVALATLVAGHASARVDHALLARPDPASGSPPRLRAPPVR